MISSSAGGTPGYRAPELTRNGPGEFTKKVDVWAVGCILCEFMADRRAFEDDEDVRGHYWPTPKSISKLITPISDLPDILKSHFTEILEELLHHDPQARPSIAKLLPMFQSYCTILNQAVAQSVHDISSIPKYSEWKGLVSGCRTSDQLLNRLTQYYRSKPTENVDGIIRLSKELVCRNPSETCFHRWLNQAYQKKGNPNAAIRGWKDIVDRCPDDERIHDELAKIIDENPDPGVVQEVWKELANNHPESTLLETRLLQATNQAKEMESQCQSSIQTLKELIYKHPCNSMLRISLKSALDTRAVKDEAIEIWEELVDKHPELSGFRIQLRRACEAKDDKDHAIRVWQKLVTKHPNIKELQVELHRARVAAAEWKKPKDSRPAYWHRVRNSITYYAESWFGAET